jgi:hypothetical protein
MHQPYHFRFWEQTRGMLISAVVLPPSLPSVCHCRPLWRLMAEQVCTGPYKWTSAAGLCLWCLVALDALYTSAGTTAQSLA